MPRRKKQKPNEATKRKATELKYIDWRYSMAKKLIMYDLQNEILPLNEDEQSAEEAWEFYRHLDIFQKVPFKQFKERVKDHRDQIHALQHRAAVEEAMFRMDREKHPRKTHNNRGQLVFDMSEAKESLRQDVIAGEHEDMTPAQLQATREEYKPFENGIFKQRIYQEVRYQKYLNYLNWKRDEEKAARSAWFQGAPRTEYEDKE